jgi:ubiquinone/menaquinone biosynthesis C-methylase UbiE
MAISADTGMNPAELANIARNEQNHWWYRGMRSIIRATLARHMTGKAAARILEAGCGTGYNSYWLRNLYGWNIFPVDIESAALRYVRSMGVSNSAQTDIRHLPFRDASFDVVLSFDVLVHIPREDESKCIAEFFRVMTPGGVLVLRAAAFDMLRSRHSQFVQEKQRFTRARLIQAASQSGFRVLYSTYANSLLLPLAIAKFRIWEPLMRRPPASSIEPPPGWVNTLLYLPLALEAKWIGAGLSLPAGQSVILVGQKPAERAVL